MFSKAREAFVVALSFVAGQQFAVQRCHGDALGHYHVLKRIIDALRETNADYYKSCCYMLVFVTARGW